MCFVGMCACALASVHVNHMLQHNTVNVFLSAKKNHQNHYHRHQAIDRASSIYQSTILRRMYDFFFKMFKTVIEHEAANSLADSLDSLRAFDIDL